MLAKLLSFTQRGTPFLRVHDYDPDQKLFRLDGKRIGFAFVCKPLAGSIGLNAERLAADLALEWPAGSSLQFSLICLENLNRIKDDYLKLRQDAQLSGRLSAGLESLEPLNAAIAARAESFSGSRLKDGGVSGMKLREQKLIVSVTLPIHAVAPSCTEAITARRLSESLALALQEIGMSPEPLNGHAYKAVLMAILNQEASWRHDRDIKADLDKPINEQLLDCNRSLDVRRDPIQLGDDCFAKTLSVKRYPDILWQGDASQYLADLLSQRGGVRGNCVITLTLFFPAQLETKDRLTKRRQWAINQCSGPMVKFVPMLLKRKEAYDALFEDLDRGAPCVQANMTVVVLDENREALEQAVTEARAHFLNLGFLLMEDRFCLARTFANALPLCADADAIRDLFRYRTMSLNQALPILPIYGDWKGTGTPVAPFISRNGQPVTFDLYDSDTNYNAIIAGPAGSGKTTLANYLITSYLSIGAKVWTLNIHHAFNPIAQALGGDLVRFDEDSRVCLNPFELVEDFSEEEDVLIGLLTAMAAPAVPLDEFQTFGLKRILTQCWERKGRDLTVEDVSIALLLQVDEPLQDIGRRLVPFTRHGQYGRYFNGKNNLSFCRPFTALELEGLKGGERLLQPLLLQLIHQIQKDMYRGDRGRPQIVVIDDAWGLLAHGSLGDFLEYLLRRFRLLGGSVIYITQDLAELNRSQAGRTIAENSAFTLLLDQRDYSEIVMVTPKGSGIARLTLDPYSRLLFSRVGPYDFEAVRVQRYTLSGLSSHQAILQVLKDRGVISRPAGEVA